MSYLISIPKAFFQYRLVVMSRLNGLTLIPLYQACCVHLRFLSFGCGRVKSAIAKCHVVWNESSRLLLVTRTAWGCQNDGEYPIEFIFKTVFPMKSAW